MCVAMMVIVFFLKGANPEKTRFVSEPEPVFEPIQTYTDRYTEIFLLLFFRGHETSNFIFFAMVIPFHSER